MTLAAGPDSFAAVNVASPVTVADGATVEIDGASAQSVTFAGTTGTLKLDDALAFTGQVSGLTGSDALDLADVSYGAQYDSDLFGQRRRRHAHGHRRDPHGKHRPARQLPVVKLDAVQRWEWRHHRR